MSRLGTALLGTALLSGKQTSGFADLFNYEWTNKTLKLMF